MIHGHPLRLVTKQSAYVFILVGMFLLSVALRSPQLGRHLSYRDGPTANSMIILLNWDSQGALNHRFCLLQTFPLDSDKYVFSERMRVMDKKGDGYYTSFPPFSLIFPYLLFKAFSIDFEIINLQLLNLIAHFIATFFIYQTLRIILPAHAGKDVAALVGGIVFIFLAPNLWFFSNFYSWDTFWIYLWAIGLYQAAQLFQQMSQAPVSSSSLYGLGLINFFLVYSDYRGLLYSLAVVLVARTTFRNTQHSKRVGGLLLLTACLPLLMTIVQYSSIDGFGTFIHAVARKGYQRSFFSASAGDSFLLVKRFLIAYGFVLAPLSLMVGIWLRTKSSEAPVLGGFTREERQMLFLAIFPVVSHHILLFQWTARHPYSMVGWSPFLALVIAMLVNKIVLGFEVGAVTKSLVTILLIASLIGSLYTYGSFYSESRSPERLYLLGETIKRHALDSEVVFVVSKVKIDTPVIYYSRRNIQAISGLETARVWLKGHGRKAGLVVYVNSDYTMDHFERVRVQER